MSDDETLVGAVLEEGREKMHKAVLHAQGDFSTVRTGRASPAMVEKLKIDYYGTPVPLQQLAGFSVPEPRLLVITPFDKGSIRAIEKAIQLSDLNINPGNDGVVIRLAIPPLTEERRREMVKVVKHKAEEARVAIRAVRRSARHDLESLEHDGDITADDLEWAEKELERVTHDHVAEIDRMLHNKEQELLEV